MNRMMLFALLTLIFSAACATTKVVDPQPPAAVTRCSDELDTKKRQECQEQALAEETQTGIDTRRELFWWLRNLIRPTAEISGSVNDLGVYTMLRAGLDIQLSDDDSLGLFLGGAAGKRVDGGGWSSGAFVRVPIRLVRSGDLRLHLVPGAGLTWYGITLDGKMSAVALDAQLGVRVKVDKFFVEPQFSLGNCVKPPGHYVCPGGSLSLGVRF